MNLIQTFLQRRSVNFFKKDVEIPERELRNIFNLAAVAPSASNTQPWEVVVVEEQEAKERLQARAFDQPKVSQASATLIMLADPEAYHGENPTYRSFVERGYMDEAGLEEFIDNIENLYSNLEEPDRFAVKNASLFAMSLMYAAEAYGWNTHPMIGFNPEEVKEEFGIPDRLIIPMLIAFGKYDGSQELLKRNKRKACEDFTSFNEYSAPGEISFENPFVEATDQTVTMEGDELHLLGPRPVVGETAPDFNVMAGPGEEKSLTEMLDKPLMISAVPSLDTPVCSLQTKKFNEKLKEKENEINFVTISCDTPFAQQRFCSAEELETPTYSDLKGKEFAINYGLLVRELGLCARAVVIIDTDRKIRYFQLVEEISEEPDYGEVVEFLDEVIT